MIVYGDPQFACNYSVLINRLQESTQALCEHGNLGQLRKLLIHAGQLEQAVADLDHPEHNRLAAASYFTDRAAAAFVAAYDSSCDVTGDCVTPAAQRQSLCEAVASLRPFGDERLLIKVPEGFEFYSLYPEQYCVGALDFIQSQNGLPPRARRAVVIGVRSIGTTLSAVVAAILRNAGWQVLRLTSRPGGEPYRRTTTLPVIARDWQWGLVVDEGPGLSGSSMVAVADALAAAGIPRVAFFPGHNHGPGAAASDSIRKRWENTPRFFARLDRLTWNGKRLRDLLAHASGVAATIEELSAGNWRRFAYKSETAWPPACIPFEQTKFLAANERGQRVLWKFQGLGSLRQDSFDNGNFSNSQAKRTRVPPVSGECLGFVATTWIEGRRLTAEHAKNPAILSVLADHIRASAKQPLTDSEQEQALQRLREMLYWNTKEALGDGFAEKTKSISPDTQALQSLASYGDGRLAPWEWISDEQGRIWKTDASGHDSDHTMPGRQSLLWDVAGAIVEWNLNASQRNILVQNLQQPGLDPNTLRFYEAAYAVFRMGQTELSRISCAHDPEEQMRLAAAAASYRERLRGLIEE